MKGCSSISSSEMVCKGASAHPAELLRGYKRHPEPLAVLLRDDKGVSEPSEDKNISTNLNKSIELWQKEF